MSLFSSIEKYPKIGNVYQDAPNKLEIERQDKLARKAPDIGILQTNFLYIFVQVAKNLQISHFDLGVLSNFLMS
jgi:hypothetical protein